MKNFGFQNNLLLETFGPTFPSAEEIERNVDIILVNSNEIIEKPRPVSHKIKYIGGMGKKKAQPLNKVINIFAKNFRVFFFRNLMISSLHLTKE